MSDAATCRVVLVGCGGMARTWVSETLAAADLELVGLVDLDRQAAEAMADRFELPRSLVYDSLAQALAQAGPDAVFDVTVPGAHEAVTIESLRGGCHVLGEKPMSQSLESARRMVAAARETGKMYAVTQTRRANPGAAAAARFLARGELGPIEEVHSDFFLGPRFEGFRAEMADVLLVDMAIHTFDNARQISGADPVSVYCHGFNPARSWYAGNASAVAIFEMVDPQGRPVVYTYRGSWCAQGLETSWNAAWRFVCHRGTLLWDGEDGFQARRVDPDAEPKFFLPTGEVEVPRVEMEHTGHAHLIREFARCVRRGEKPSCPAEDNLKSLAMVLGAVRSAREGKRVAVDTASSPPLEAGA